MSALPATTALEKYGVDNSAIDALALSALSRALAPEAYLVDEIGKIECMSREFVAAMKALFAMGRPIVATVALRGDGFNAEAKALPNAELWRVTRENRDCLPEQIAARLCRHR